MPAKPETAAYGGGGTEGAPLDWVASGGVLQLLAAATASPLPTWYVVSALLPVVYAALVLTVLGDDAEPPPLTAGATAGERPVAEVCSPLRLRLLLLLRGSPCRRRGAALVLLGATWGTPTRVR